MKPAILLILLTPTFAFARAPKFDTILYGASYYHEYMPYDRLDKDVELMEKAGITVVRLGESTWSSWEPREGEFEFAWMERILDRLHKAGIKVILGTPTYSIPPWLYRKHPEIAVSQIGARQPLGSDRYQGAYFGNIPWGAYGLRQNVDLTQPTYRWYAERVACRIETRPGSADVCPRYQCLIRDHERPASVRSGGAERRPAGRVAVHRHDLSGGDFRRAGPDAGRPAP